MRKGEPVIVVVYGGCVTDVLGVNNYTVFDWDNFECAPVSYVDDNGGLEGEYFQTICDHAPELYDSIVKEFNEALLDAETERRKDPFCDVEAR